MPKIENWPHSNAVAVLEGDGQVRLLILQPPDAATIARWEALYPHLPIAEAAKQFEEAGYGGT